MRWLALLTTTALAATSPSAMAGPPITGLDVQSPSSEAARRWAVAAFQAPFLEYFGDQVPRSEAVRMLATVQRGEQLRAGVGWYGPAARRYDWSWFADRYDTDHDGRVTRKEFKGETEFFTRLDRDHDGVITADDFNWSEQSAWVKHDSQSLRFFRGIDGNGNGKIHEAEMLAYFRKLAGDKGYVTPDDLRNALTLENVKRKPAPKRVSQEVWIESLFASDLGSPFEGPVLDEDAPDFTLKSQDGKKRFTLSQTRGKQPVVLIFGSFT
jgi:Ca2+-binding EF-hand superfamily protein